MESTNDAGLHYILGKKEGAGEYENQIQSYLGALQILILQALL